MYLNGPFVPPQCPVEREGVVDNLTDARFTLHVQDYSGTGKTEVFGSFYGHGEEDKLTTGVITVTSEYGIALQARNFRQGDEVIVEGGRWLEALRLALCRQVSDCHGIVNGQCWALGKIGLFSAMADVVCEEQIGSDPQ